MRVYHIDEGVPRLTGMHVIIAIDQSRPGGLEDANIRVQLGSAEWRLNAADPFSLDDISGDVSKCVIEIGVSRKMSSREPQDLAQIQCTLVDRRWIEDSGVTASNECWRYCQAAALGMAHELELAGMLLGQANRVSHCLE